MNVYPAILEEDIDGLVDKIERVKKVEGVVVDGDEIGGGDGGFGIERVQIDVVDGLFANTVTVTPSDIKEVEFGGLGVDFHLMVDDPMAWIEECNEVDDVRIIAQIERMGSQNVFVDWVCGYDVKVGLALDLFTPVESLDRSVLDRVDCVLLMSVKAGMQRQQFRDVVLDKVSGVREFYDGEIIVDGGVNGDNVRLLKDKGADGVAVGSYLWDGDLDERLRSLLK